MLSSTSNSVVSFRERRVVALDHDFMLYVCGVNVTDYVAGSVEWSIAGRSGQNSLSFTLSNANDCFVITDDNLNGKWPGLTAKYGWQYSAKIKNSIFYLKGGLDPKRNPVDPMTGEHRYPFVPHRSIFHLHDRVRLFIKDPLSTTKWMPAFCGFLSTSPVSDDKVTGLSQISVSCCDLRALLDKMRVQTNQVFGKILPEPLFNRTAGIFKDLSTSSLWSHVLAGKSFIEIMHYLLTGGGQRNSEVGNMRPGYIFEVNPKGDLDFEVKRKNFNVNPEKAKILGDSSLEQWNDMCVFGPSMDYLTREQCMLIGEGTFEDGPYDPLNAATVNYLMPKSGTGFGELVEFAPLSPQETDRSFVTRLSLINEVCEKIGYEWWVTGWGDVVFEFPMSDFEPALFGAYKPVYEFDYDVISDDFEHESGDICTALAATGGFLYQPDPRNQADQILFPRAWVMAPVLASRVGVTSETTTFPFTHNLKRLCLLVTVEFFRKLSNANKIGLNMLYRPYMLPNRPLLVVDREKMGTTETISYSLDPIGFSASLSTTLTLPRDAKPSAEGGRKEYHFVTGGKQAPISYRNFGGVGLLIGSYAGLTTHCSYGADSDAVAGGADATEVKARTSAAAQQLRASNAALAGIRSGGSIGSGGGSDDAGAGGKTREEIRARAKALGVSEDDVILAYMLKSETGIDMARIPENKAIMNTAFNRVEKPASETGAHSSSMWRAIVGGSDTTGSQGENINGVPTSVRPYGTSKEPSDAEIMRTKDMADQVRKERAAGIDSSGGASCFYHSNGNTTAETKHRTKRVGQGFSQVSVAGTDANRIQFYKYNGKPKKSS